MADTTIYKSTYTGKQIDEAIGKALRGVQAVTVTITASGWNENTQMVTVDGVLSDETKQRIIPIPASVNQEAYIEAGVRCVEQKANSLIFSCDKVPKGDLTVYITIEEVKMA